MSDNNLALKVYTLEADQKYLNDKIEKIESTLESHVEVTYDIKERIDKWDGFMPHMVNTMNKLADNQEEIKNSITKRELNNSAKTTELTTKFKILWGILAFLGVTFVGFVVHMLEKHF
jgi:hypothetical protein